MFIMCCVKLVLKIALHILKKHKLVIQDALEKSSEVVGGFSVDFSPVMKLLSQLDCNSGSGKQRPADQRQN